MAMATRKKLATTIARSIGRFAFMMALQKSGRLIAVSISPPRPHGEQRRADESGHPQRVDRGRWRTECGSYPQHWKNGRQRQKCPAPNAVARARGPQINR